MVEPFEIRVTGRGDIAAVDALLARSYPRQLAADYPPSVLVTALPLISRAQPGLVTSGTYYAAVTPEGRIVGAGGWTRSSPQGGRRADGDGHIRHLVTDDRMTRQGIGRAIIGRILADAGAGGVTLLDCLSTRTAVPFYAAMGFRVLGPVEVSLRPGIGFPAIRMQRRI